MTSWHSFRPLECWDLARLDWIMQDFQLNSRQFKAGCVRVLHVPEDNGEAERGSVWTLGVSWSPMEFFDQARKLPHPMDAPPVLPDEFVRAAVWVCVGVVPLHNKPGVKSYVHNIML